MRTIHTDAEGKMIAYSTGYREQLQKNVRQYKQQLRKQLRRAFGREQGDRVMRILTNPSR